MSFSTKLKREVEVAFSKHAQPIWFRIVKYLVLSFVLYLFWGSKLFWFILFLLFIVAMIVHFWYRYKTQGWTRSYGLWDYEKNKSKLK